MATAISRLFRERQWKALRGKDIGFVLQDALVSLDPLRAIGDEIAEALSAHGGWRDRGERTRRVLELLDSVGIPEPQRRVRQRPDQLSGGLRQRALIATALALEPPILIADEPTTALDATIQAQILDLLDSIKRRGTGLLIISHDLSVVSRIADEVVVLRHGEVVEQGPTSAVLAGRWRPTRASCSSPCPGRGRGRRDPSARCRGRARGERPMEGLSRPGRARSSCRCGCRLCLRAGRTIGIVGESGSGKSTTARIALGLLDPDEGSVRFDGKPWVGSAKRASASASGARTGRISASSTRIRSHPSIRAGLSVRSWRMRSPPAAVPRTEHADRIAALLLDRVRLPADCVRRGPSSSRADSASAWRSREALRRARA